MKGQLLFESTQYTASLFPAFLIIERVTPLKSGAKGQMLKSDHPQFNQWAAAFDDIEDVREGDNLCRCFLN